MGITKQVMTSLLIQSVIGGGGAIGAPTAPYVVNGYYSEVPGTSSTCSVVCNNNINTGDLIVVAAAGWNGSDFSIGIEDTVNGTYSDTATYQQQQTVEITNEGGDATPLTMWTRVAGQNYTNLTIRTSGSSYLSMVVLIVRNYDAVIFDDGGTRPTPVKNYVNSVYPVLTYDNPETTYSHNLIIAAFAWYSSAQVMTAVTDWPVSYGRNESDSSTARLVVSVRTVTAIGNYDPAMSMSGANESQSAITALIIKGRNTT